MLPKTDSINMSPRKSRSRSRSPVRSRRSRSSRSGSPRTPSPIYNDPRGYSDDEKDKGYRLFISNIGNNPDDNEIKRVFKKFGGVTDFWLAHNPPCFGFVVYTDRKDAEKALDQANGRMVDGHHIRVDWARPRRRFGVGDHRGSPRGGGRAFNSRRCYQCGKMGHFSRECWYVVGFPSSMRDSRYRRDSYRDNYRDSYYRDRERGSERERHGSYSRRH